MNRLLLIPAVGCLVAFGVAAASFYRAEGREQDTEAVAYLAPKSRDLRDEGALAPRDAEQKLQALAAQYLQPWRQWESSPHRLLSRVAPRPVPSISEQIQLVDSRNQPAGCCLATITITIGEQAEQTPCIVDCRSGEVHLFDGGKWLTEYEWLKQAPLPSRRF
jgi:hypothetical protein